MSSDSLSPALAKGMRTPKGTEHTPTHRRTLSGRLVPLDEQPRAGWIELVADYVERKHEALKENPPPVRERIGEWYQALRKIPHPAMLKEWGCSLCFNAMSAKECRHANGVDVYDNHAVARYSSNRAMRRAWMKRARRSA